MRNIVKYPIFLATLSALVVFSCSKSSKYELDTYLSAPELTQTAIVTHQSWQPEIDFKTDAALFISTADTQVIDSWRKNGYQIQFQIDPYQKNSSNFTGNLILPKKFSTIISITGEELQFFNPESLSFYKRLQSPDLSGIQGKIDLNWFSANSTAAESPVFQFKKAFLKGSYFKNLIRFTQKPLWFNIELPTSNDHLNWPDLWAACQQTMVALLMHPEITGFHFQQIAEQAKNEKQTVQNVHLNQNLFAGMALFNNILHSINQFEPDDFIWFSAINHVGQLVSQSIYLPADSVRLEQADELASALLSCGIPAERLILERCNTREYLNGYRILFLDYNQLQTPTLTINDNIAHWVRTGGVLIIAGGKELTKNTAPNWWQKLNFATPMAHLLHRLKMPSAPGEKFYKSGKGNVIFKRDGFVHSENQQIRLTEVRSLLEEAVFSVQDALYLLKPQNYLCLYRGPLVLAAVMPDAENKKMLEIPGTYIDCLAPSCPLIDEKIVAAGEVALLFNLKKFQNKRNEVILSNSKITNQKLNSPEFSFDSQGPSGMECQTFIKLILMPREIVLHSQAGEVNYRMEWYPREKLLRLVYPMTINGVHIKLSW
jgi:hypothetical protein